MRSAETPLSCASTGHAAAITSTPETDKTAVNFRRRLPEIRWQPCLSPVPLITANPIVLNMIDLLS
jgi:hypothetical protein